MTKRTPKRRECGRNARPANVGGPGFRRATTTRAPWSALEECRPSREGCERATLFTRGPLTAIADANIARVIARFQLLAWLRRREQRPRKLQHVWPELR